MFARYAHVVIHYPYRVLLTVLLVVLALAMQLPKLGITTDLRVFFSADNPQLKAFEATEQTYGQQNNILFFIAPREGDIFTPATLKLIFELSERGWQFPYAQRVSSLSNFQYTYADGDDITTESLIDSPDQLTEQGISRIRRIAMDETALRNNALASDGSATSVNILLTLPDDNQGANEEVAYYARGVAEELRQQYPGVEILLSGSAIANVTLGEAVKQDFYHLVIISYLVIVVGLFLLLRSLGGTLITLMVISFAILGTMGIYGYLERVLTPVAGFVPSIVMTIAVADSVHILVSYFFNRNQGSSKQDAVQEALRINVVPVFVTSLTTIIGVLTLNFSDSPPYRDLGNMVAIGVALAYFLSLFLIPSLLMILPTRQWQRRQAMTNRMDDFADWVIRQRRVLLYGIGFGVILFTAFISRNQLTERWHDYFDTTFPERQAIDAIDGRLSGVHALRYSVQTHRQDGINDPAYLHALDQFVQWYRQQEEVAFASSITDTLKRLNKNMHGDDPAEYRLPDNSDLTAQYLLFYELSLPLGLGLENAINQQRSAAQMVVVVHKTHSEKLLELDRRARDWAARHIPQLQVEEATGLDMVFAHINHRNIRSLLQGTALALVLISLVLIAVLRSVRLGLISMLPNLAPAALAYGTWGLLVGEIDLSASMVIAMTLGIVVDDTVHFLMKYLRARREKNLDAREGIRYAFHTVGVALVITTVVLVSGFLVLTFSHFSPTSTTGTLLAITLSFALLIDFLLLPPLLIQLDEGTQKKSTSGDYAANGRS